MDDILLKNVTELRKLSQARNIPKLKDMGGDIAELAYLRGDRRLVNLVIISYSIAKFLEKHYISGSPDFAKFFDYLLKTLSESAECLKSNDEQEFFGLIDSMVEEIKSLSDSEGRFRSNIIEKAKIKAGTQVYAHGASLSVAADFAGVEKNELAAYINVTKLPDKYGTMSVKDRMRMADEIFGN